MYAWTRTGKRLLMLQSPGCRTYMCDTDAAALPLLSRARVRTSMPQAARDASRCMTKFEKEIRMHSPENQLSRNFARGPRPRLLSGLCACAMSCHVAKCSNKVNLMRCTDMKLDPICMEHCVVQCSVTRARARATARVTLQRTGI